MIDLYSNPTREYKDNVDNSSSPNENQENCTRLMGMPGMPITPDDVYPESIQSTEFNGEQQQQLLTQILWEAEELFRQWDYSRPELLNAQGVRIGVCPVQDWPGGDKFAPSRRFFLFSGDRRVEFEETYDVDPAGTAGGDDDDAAAYRVEKEALYCITFFLLQPTPQMLTARRTDLVSSFQALAHGHMIPELLLCDPPALPPPPSPAAPPATPRTPGHAPAPESAGARSRPRRPQEGGREWEERLDECGLLSPRIVERFRQPFDMDQLLRPATPATPAAASGGGSPGGGGSADAAAAAAETPRPRHAIVSPAQRPPAPRPPPWPRERGWGIVLAPPPDAAAAAAAGDAAAADDHPALAGLVMVHEMVAGSPAAASGLLRTGDRVAAVDGADVAGAPPWRVGAALAAAAAAGRVQLSVLRRGPPGHGPSSGFGSTGPVSCYPVDGD
jgi:hypothetical protein